MFRRTTRTVLIALLAAVAQPVAQSPASATALSPADYPVGGIDVSNHQSTIAWSTVAYSGQRYMYAKASEGVHFTDPFFGANYAFAKAYGMYAGAYHYARPDRSTGAAQADYFLDRAQYQNDGRTLPPMLDIEWPWQGSGSVYPCYGLSPTQLVTWIRDFVDRIRARTGRQTMIYTNANWWNPCTASNTSFGDEPLFTARYAADPTPLPAGWSTFALWQFTSSAVVPGISGLVDRSVFNGSLGDLARLAGAQWPRVLGDYNGDGRDEAAVWRPTDGKWWVAYSGGGGVFGQRWGLPGDVPVVGDYDGDRRDDLTVWRPANATWWVRPASGPEPTVGVQWGFPTDMALAGDVNGDGRTDFVVWRPSTGTWWVRYAGSGAVVVVQWGLIGDVPLMGDFNGDGSDDFAVWRPSNGTWWVRLSTGAVYAASLQWGLSGDVPLVGDLNGDGRDDFAIWRPSNGSWWVRYAGSGGTLVSWGVAGDYPLVGDVGGNGADDFAIWRPTDSSWWVRYSDFSGYVAHFVWGTHTDIPM